MLWKEHLLENTENFTDKAIDHIFEGEVNGRGNGTGYHYEGIESSPGSVIEGTRGISNEFGVYEGRVEVNGVPKTENGGMSTFFPEEMTPQQVIDTTMRHIVTRLLLMAILITVLLKTEWE